MNGANLPVFSLQTHHLLEGASDTRSSTKQSTTSPGLRKLNPKS